MTPAIRVLEARVQKATELYHSSKTLQSAALLGEVESALESAEQTGEEIDGLRQRLRVDPDVERIKTEAERVFQLRETLSSDEHWTVTSVTGCGVRTLFRQDEETHPFHLFRVEGFVDAPLLHLLSILCEIDLWPSWMIPQTWVCGLRAARVVKHLSPTHLLCYLAATMPWPIAHRDIVLEVKAVDCMDAHEKYKRQIVVLLNDITQFPGADIPAEESYVHAGVKSSGILLTPDIPEDGGPIRRTHVQLVICADPRLPYVPPWVMNQFMKNLVFLFLPALRRQVLEVPKQGSVYRDRMARNPELYGFLQARMKECFPTDDPAVPQEG